MLTTELKSMDSILSLINGKTVIVSCVGCKELHFPEIEAAELRNELLDSGKALTAIITDYICNPDNLRLQLRKYMDIVDAADSLLIFSCGVGVQTVAEIFPSKNVYAACDTYFVPGHQGVSPTEYDCAQCGDCYLNDTGGICPITSCSKSLVNGQCGGSKNGMCEVNKDMECGWERIYRRLERLGYQDTLLSPVKVRDFTAGTASDT